MFSVLRSCAAILVAVSLAGCEVNKDVASPEAIQAVAYSDDSQPTSLTLFTMVSNSSGKGAHTSLLINASQTVVWDPAGSFRAPSIVTNEDVVFGMTPQMVDFYTRFHARETYHVIIQKLPVSAAVAEQALQTVMAYGAVPQANCAASTSAIMKTLPGFEGIKSTYYPNNLHEQFAAYDPDEQKMFEYDGDDKTKVLEAYNAERVAETLARRKTEGTTIAAKN